MRFLNDYIEYIKRSCKTVLSNNLSKVIRQYDEGILELITGVCNKNEVYDNNNDALYYINKLTEVHINMESKIKSVVDILDNGFYMNSQNNSIAEKHTKFFEQIMKNRNEQIYPEKTFYNYVHSIFSKKKYNYSDSFEKVIVHIIKNYEEEMFNSDCENIIQNNKYEMYEFYRFAVRYLTTKNTGNNTFIIYNVKKYESIEQQQKYVCSNPLYILIKNIINDPYHHPSISDIDLSLIKNMMEKILPYIVTNVNIDYTYFINTSTNMNVYSIIDWEKFTFFDEVDHSSNIIDIVARWINFSDSSFSSMLKTTPQCSVSHSLDEFEKRNRFQQKITRSIILDAQYILPTMQCTLLLTIQQKQQIVETSALLMNTKDKNTNIDILFAELFYYEHLKNFNGIISELDLYELLFGKNKHLILKKYECSLFDIFSVFEAFQIDFVSIKKDIFTYFEKNYEIVFFTLDKYVSFCNDNMVDQNPSHILIALLFEFIRNIYKIITMIQYETTNEFKCYVQLKSIKCLISDYDIALYSHSFWTVNEFWEFFIEEYDKKCIFLREQVCQFLMYNVNMKITVNASFSDDKLYEKYSYHYLRTIPDYIYYFRYKNDELECIKSSKIVSSIKQDVIELGKLYFYDVHYCHKTMSINLNTLVTDVEQFTRGHS